MTIQTNANNADRDFTFLLQNHAVWLTMQDHLACVVAIAAALVIPAPKAAVVAPTVGITAIQIIVVMGPYLSRSSFRDSG